MRFITVVLMLVSMVGCSSTTQKTDAEPTAAYSENSVAIRTPANLDGASDDMKKLNNVINNNIPQKYRDNLNALHAKLSESLNRFDGSISAQLAVEKRIQSIRNVIENNISQNDANHKTQLSQLVDNIESQINDEIDNLMDSNECVITQVEYYYQVYRGNRRVMSWTAENQFLSSYRELVDKGTCPKQTSYTCRVIPDDNPKMQHVAGNSSYVIARNGTRLTGWSLKSGWAIETSQGISLSRLREAGVCR